MLSPKPLLQQLNRRRTTGWATEITFDFSLDSASRKAHASSLQIFKHHQLYTAFCANSVKIPLLRSSAMQRDLSCLFKHLSAVVLTDQRHVQKKFNAVAANHCVAPCRKQTYVKMRCFNDSAKKLLLKCPDCPKTMEHNTKRQYKAQVTNTIWKKYEKVMHTPVIIIAALQKSRDFTLSEAGGAGDAQTHQPPEQLCTVDSVTQGKQDVGEGKKCVCNAAAAEESEWSCS